MIWAGALALAYALVSLLWAPGGQLWALAEIATLVIAFWIGRQYDPSRLWLWFPVIALAPLPFVFHLNPDYVACVISLATVMAVAYDQWLFIPIGFGALWFCGARGPILATGIGILYLKFKKYPAISMCTVLLALLVDLNLHHGLGPTFQRIGIWQDTINHLSVWGHGFGSFATIYRTWSPHTNVTFYLPTHAYNDPLELISDLGVGTIPLWFFLALAIIGTDRCSRAILLTFALLGLTYFPLWIPPCAQIAALALGHLSKRKSQRSTDMARPLKPSRHFGLKPKTMPYRG